LLGEFALGFAIRERNEAHVMTAELRNVSPTVTDDSSKYRGYLGVFVSVLGVFLLYQLPLIIAGRPALDDMFRSVVGNFDWSVAGRPLAEVLFFVLNVGSPATAVFGINQLVAVAFLAAAATSLSLAGGISRPLFAAIAAIPFGAQPYLLANLGYSFDAPFMAAGFLAATLSAILVSQRSSAAAIGAGAILFLCSVALYQPTANVFFLICAFFLAKALISTPSKVGPIAVRALVAAATGGLVYWIYVKTLMGTASGEFASYVANASAFAEPASLVPVIGHNTARYWSLVAIDLGPGVLALLAGVVLVVGFVLLLVGADGGTNHTGVLSRLIGVALAGVLLAAVFVFQFGIMLPLLEPIWEPRVFVAAGVLPGLAAIQMVAFAQSRLVGDRYRAMAIGAVVAVVALDYVILVCSHAIAAASRAQLAFETSYASRLIAELEQLPSSIDRMVFVGPPAATPVIHNTARKFPIVRRIVRENWTGNLLTYNGLQLTEGATALYQRAVSEGRLSPVVQRRSYSIFVDGSTAVVAFATPYEPLPKGGVPSRAAVALSELEVRALEALENAAGRIGLKRSDSIIGYVDNVAWAPDGSVLLRGWAIDQAGDGSPLQLVAFAAGESFAISRTEGSREDIVKTFSLSGKAAANVAFAIQSLGPIACSAGDSFVVVAMNGGGSFAPLGFYQRDTGCAE
jgi:hypothetical protein